MTTQKKITELALFREEVSHCELCPDLVVSRIKTVFGEGNPDARLVLCGEGPGSAESKSGRPFVGVSGKLLDNIIKACGWKREDLYILNVVCCRPPNNRVPTKTEAKNCRRYLDVQIDLVAPEWIVCLGATAASNLLGVGPYVSPLRGKIFTYKMAQVVVTWHPSYLLQNPSAKRETWQDLQVVIVIAGLQKNASSTEIHQER
jgi:uracil-DNA glycosylase